MNGKHMNTFTLDEFTKKIAQMATSTTSKMEEQQKYPSYSFISNALLLPMIMQSFRLIAAMGLTFLAIALTVVSVVYRNLKEIKNEKN